MSGRLSKLPPFGPAVQKLLSISIDDESAVAAFEEVFKTDLALTAELLVMANSAVFGRRARVQTIEVAIRALGLERVRALATTSALRAHTAGRRDPYLATVWAHGVATAVAAEALGDLCGVPGLYTLGLTHDLGRLGLFLVSGQAYARELSKEFQDVEEASQLESSFFGMTHSEAGEVVAEAWAFPEALAHCMGRHHLPSVVSPGCPESLIAAACQIADSLGFPEVPLTAPLAWPVLGPTFDHHSRIEPETLWDEITRRMADLA